MTILGMREPEWDGSYRNRVWSLALGIGAGAVLLFLQFTPRPFLATIAAILWLVALMGVAALVQIRQAHMTARRLGWIAWRIAGASYIVGAAILIADPLHQSRQQRGPAVRLVVCGFGLERLLIAAGGQADRHRAPVRQPLVEPRRAGGHVLTELREVQCGLHLLAARGARRPDLHPVPERSPPQLEQNLPGATLF